MSGDNNEIVVGARAVIVNGRREPFLPGAGFPADEGIGIAQRRQLTLNQAIWGL